MAGLSSLGIAGQALVFGVGFGALCVAGYGLYKLYKAVDQHLEQKLLSDKLHNASIYAMQWSALKNQVIDYENSGQKENVRLSKIEADNAFKKSLEHYQEVLKMIPSDTKEHKEVWEEKTRLELMHQFENNEFDKILKTCNAILEEKNNENIQIMRAQAYIAIGKPWLAENDYLFLGDTNITAQIQLSYLSEQYGDLYNAALYTARAISLLQTELSNLRDEIKKINNGTYHLGGAADSAYELIKNNPKAASLLTLDNKFKKHTELDIKQQSLQSSEKELSEQKEHQNTISRSVQDTKYQLAGNIAATVMTSFIQSIADIIFQWQKITYNNPYNFPIFTIIPLPNTSSKKPIVTSTNLERLSRSLSNRPQQQKLYNNLIKSSRTIIPTHSYRENIFSNLSKNIQTQKLHTNLAFFSKVNPLNKQSNTMYIFQRK